MKTSTAPTADRPSTQHPNGQSPWMERVSHEIQEHPLRSVAQAALVGLALHHLPVRRLIGAAMRLIVPGIFAAGLYQVYKQLPPESKRPAD
jgi:hypothetical protein